MKKKGDEKELKDSSSWRQEPSIHVFHLFESTSSPYERLFRKESSYKFRSKWRERDDKDERKEIILSERERGMRRKDEDENEDFLSYEREEKVDTFKKKEENIFWVHITSLFH